MVQVSNLPSLPSPTIPATDVAVVSRNNQLFSITFDELFAAGSINVDESTVDHDLLLNYNSLEHIDWTNASESIVTTGLIMSSNVSGINTGDQNLFGKFAVLGLTALDDIVATTTNDTFTFVPGPNVSITTNPVTKELFISAAGGGGGLPIEVAEQSYTNPADFSGFTSVLVLPVAPTDPDNVLVFFDGVFEGDASYVIAGALILFTSNIPAYVSKVDIMIYNEPDLTLDRGIFTAGVEYNIGDPSITLPSAPDDEDHLLLFFNGAMQGTPSYSVSGTLVTFTGPIPAGTSKIEYVIFTDVGSSLLDLDLHRQVYLDGVNFTAGLTTLLPLPSSAESNSDVLVFFDAVFQGSSNYTVNNTILNFNAAIPSFTSKVEVITLVGGESISSLSFGRIDVPTESSVLATTTSDTFTLIPGTNVSITTLPASNSITINNTQVLPSIFDVITGDTGADLTASGTSTVNFVGGTDIDVTSDGVDTLTIDFTGVLDGEPDQNLFDRAQIDTVDAFTAGTTTDPINFEQGSGITITNPSLNTIKFETSAGFGEVNTSSNVGLGQTLVLPKVGVDLPFKGIDNVDTNVTVSTNATDVLIDLNIVNLEPNLNHDNLTGFVLNEHIDWTNATQDLSTLGTVNSSNYDVTGSVAAGSTNSGNNSGDQSIWNTITATTGPNFVPTTLNDSLNFAAGTNVTITSNGTDTLTIAAATIGEVNTGSNVGGFQQIFKQKSGVDFEFRTLHSSNGTLTVTQNTNDVDIVITPGTGFTESFVSGPQVITPAGGLVLGHGLTGQPQMTFVVLVNVVPEFNYLVGQQTPANAATGASSNNQGTSIVPDASNLNIRFGAGSGGGTPVYSVIDRTTGATNGITNANWQAIFIAVR